MVSQLEVALKFLVYVAEVVTAPLPDEEVEPPLLPVLDVLPVVEVLPVLDVLPVPKELPLLEVPEVFPALLPFFPALPQAAMPSIMRTERAKGSERFNHKLLDLQSPRLPLPGQLGGLRVQELL